MPGGLEWKHFVQSHFDKMGPIFWSEGRESKVEKLIKRKKIMVVNNILIQKLL